MITRNELDELKSMVLTVETCMSRGDLSSQLRHFHKSTVGCKIGYEDFILRSCMRSEVILPHKASYTLSDAGLGGVGNKVSKSLDAAQQLVFNVSERIRSLSDRVQVKQPYLAAVMMLNPADFLRSFENQSKFSDLRIVWMINPTVKILFDIALSEVADEMKKSTRPLRESIKSFAFAKNDLNLIAVSLAKARVFERKYGICLSGTFHAEWN